MPWHDEKKSVSYKSLDTLDLRENKYFQNEKVSWFTIKLAVILHKTWIIFFFLITIINTRKSIFIITYITIHTIIIKKMC